MSEGADMAVVTSTQLGGVKLFQGSVVLVVQPFGVAKMNRCWRR